MSGYCNECGNTICVCGEILTDVKSRDRAALEELVYYCLNASFITASRAREILGFGDMETLRGWWEKKDEKNK